MSESDADHSAAWPRGRLELVIEHLDALADSNEHERWRAESAKHGVREAQQVLIALEDA